MKVKIEAVLRGGLVVVDARGLRRVVVKQTGEVLDELLSPDEAELSAQTYNELFPGRRARVVRYSATTWRPAS